MWFIFPIPRVVFSPLGAGLGCLTLGGLFVAILALVALTFLWPLIPVLLIILIALDQRTRNAVGWKLKEAEGAASAAVGFLEEARRAADSSKADRGRAREYLAAAKRARADAGVQASRAEAAAQEAKMIAARGFIWKPEPLLQRADAATEAACSAASDAHRPVISAAVTNSTAAIAGSIEERYSSLRRGVGRLRWWK